MRDPFNGIYYRASKIICWVDLPFITRKRNRLERHFLFVDLNIPSTVMRYRVASVDNRITKSFIRIVNADFSSDAPS